MAEAETIARIRKIVVVAACCLYGIVGVAMALTHPGDRIQASVAPEPVVAMKGNFLREAFAEMPPEGVDTTVTGASPLGPASSFHKEPEPLELAEVVFEPQPGAKVAKAEPEAESHGRRPVVSEHHDYCYPGHRVDYGRHWRCVYARQSHRHRHG